MNTPLDEDTNAGTSPDSTAQLLAALAQAGLGRSLTARQCLAAALAGAEGWRAHCAALNADLARMAAQGQRRTAPLRLAAAAMQAAIAQAPRLTLPAAAAEKFRLVATLGCLRPSRPRVLVELERLAHAVEKRASRSRPAPAAPAAQTWHNAP